VAVKQISKNNLKDNELN